MSGKIFVRAIGAVACVAAFATSWDAEAARCHRRRCCDPCCYVEPVCCQPTCCETTCCAPACSTVVHYDRCGRAHYHRVACCETVISETIVTPACCGIASTASSSAAIATAGPAPAAKTLAVAK